MILSLLLFALAFCIAFLTTPWVIRLAERSSLGLDAPDETRKRHDRQIPRLGGMPILLALSVALILILLVRPESTSDWFPTLLGMLLMTGLGLWDDFKPLGARKKLIGQILIAVLVYSLGLRVERMTYPDGRWNVEL